MERKEEDKVMERNDTREDKVWVSVEATINLGNYENIRIMTGGSRTVSPKKDTQEVREEMIGQMIEEVLYHGEKVRKERRRKESRQ